MFRVQVTHAFDVNNQHVGTWRLYSLFGWVFRQKFIQAIPVKA